MPIPDFPGTGISPTRMILKQEYVSRYDALSGGAKRLQSDYVKAGNQRRAHRLDVACRITAPNSAIGAYVTGAIRVSRDPSAASCVTVAWRHDNAEMRKSPELRE